MTWAECKPYLSFIRAAVAAHLPPKQVIFNDPSHKEYDFWDLRLLKAYFFTQDFFREGVPIWWDESDEVMFDAVPRISRSRAAVQRAEQNENAGDKSSPPGRYFVPEPKPRMGGQPLPTFADWLKERERKSGSKKARN